MHSKGYFMRLLVLMLLILAIPAVSFAGVFVSITVAPPPLPVYVQPPCPEPGYMWTPGYWAWGDDGYYWVPGTWVPAPAVGLLWTPGYWGWVNGIYRWNGGYWGPHIGFYGGVNYGFGYGGVGFVGGEWRHGGFFYNSAVLNVGGAHITNVYVNRTVIVNNKHVSNVSFNGGAGGIHAAPNAAELHAAQEHHVQATAEQTRHEGAAAKNPQLLAKNNGGKPAIAASAKASDFSSKSVVPAKSAGGKIEPASLHASAKSMPPKATPPKVTPPPSKNAAGGQHPAANSGNNTPAGHNPPPKPVSNANANQPKAHAQPVNTPAPHAQSQTPKPSGNQGGKQQEEKKPSGHEKK